MESIAKTDENITNLAPQTEILDKLLTVISHELRSPIGSFKSFIDILLNNKNTEYSIETRETLQLISKSSNTIFHTLENILFWARLERNSYLFDYNYFSLNELVEEILITQKILISEKNISIEFEKLKIYFVYSDRNLLAIVFRNLFSNSIKFSHLGGKIKIKITQTIDNKLIVNISDNGIGIDELKREHIFDFNQSNPTFGTYNEKGAGMGLCITKKILLSLGGDIILDKTNDSGTTFTLSLPITK